MEVTELNQNIVNIANFSLYFEIKSLGNHNLKCSKHPLRVMNMLRHVFTWEDPSVKLLKAKVTIFSGAERKND